ncbi:hypothetical protein [Rubritalea tangerina]|uniref:hypothetical protein n=1 Tax=Rubritalea tangerina TaxID=430798 RepID=UPI0036111F04
MTIPPQHPHNALAPKYANNLVSPSPPIAHNTHLQKQSLHASSFIPTDLPNTRLGRP